MKTSSYPILIFCLLLGADSIAQTNTVGTTNTTQSTQLEVRISGTDLYKALVSDTTREVDKLAAERDSDHWKIGGLILSIIVGLVGYLGYQNISELRRKIAMDVAEDLRSHETLKSLVEEAVRANVTSSIENRLHTVSKELAFYRLSNLAASIAAGTGFRRTERDAAVESLEQLSNESAIIQRKEFVDVLEKILDTFAAADLDFELDLISDKLESVIMDAPGIVQTLTMHYGMRVLGDVEVNMATMTRFQKYAEACRRHSLYELALPYLLVIEHDEKRTGWEQRIQSLQQDMSHLESKEQKTAHELLQRNSDPKKVAKRSTGQILRFCGKFKAFDDYVKSIKGKSNKASEATSVPAQSAVPSSPQG